MQGGIDQAAKNVGLGKPIDIRLARKEMNWNSSTMFAINTDQQSTSQSLLFSTSFFKNYFCHKDCKVT